MGKKLADITSLRLILGCCIMLDFRQTDTLEDHGYSEYQDTQNGIRYSHVATFIGIIEKKLTDAKCSEDTAQAIKRLRKVQAAGSCLPGSQFRYVWIGCRFQEDQSTADNEEAKQESIEAADCRSWNKKQ